MNTVSTRKIGAGMVRVGYRQVFDPVRGVTTEATYEGSIKAAEAMFIAEQGKNSNYCEITVGNDPPIGRVVLRTPDYDDGSYTVQTQYELVPGMEQRSGWEHYNTLNISNADKKVIRDEINKAKPKHPGDSTLGLSGNALTFYTRLYNGQSSYATSQFVFRLIQQFSSRGVVSIAYSNVNKVYASSGVISETGCSGTIYQTAINSAYDTIKTNVYRDNVPSGFTLGWLKQAPSIVQTAGNKSAVTVEYWLEAWPNYYYG